jgi:hypothetical protein
MIMSGNAVTPFLSTDIWILVIGGAGILSDFFTENRFLNISKVAALMHLMFFRELNSR